MIKRNRVCAAADAARTIYWLNCPAERQNVTYNVFDSSWRLVYTEIGYPSNILSIEFGNFDWYRQKS